MKAIKIENRYEIYDNSLQTFDRLPAKVYTVCFDKMTGFYLNEHTEFNINEKIYGVHLAKVDKVIASFGKFERSLGVILSGDKGIGKSLFAKLVCIREEVCNCLIWRQQDATRNSIEAVGQAFFSHAQLHQKTCNMIQEMLWSEKNINWNEFPTMYKRGSCCYRVQQETTIPDPVNKDTSIEVTRRNWFIDVDPPIFTQDREYIERLL